MRKLVLALLLATAAPAIAVVPSTSSYTQVTGNGLATAFTFTFAVTTISAHVEVLLGGVKQSNGFTVTLNANQTSSPGGTVTFDAAPAPGMAVRIQRTVPLTQDTVYTPYSAFPAKTTEKALDRLAYQVQQLDRLVRVDQDARDDAQDLALAQGSAGGNDTFITATGGSAAQKEKDRWGVFLTLYDFGGVGNGIADESSVLAAAAVVSVSLGVEIGVPKGSFRVDSAATLNGARFRGLGGRLVVTTSASPVFSVASGFSVRDLDVQLNTTYGDATQNVQWVFGTSSRATGVVAENVYAYANTLDQTGATRGGELFHGYFADSRFTAIRTKAIRNGIVSDGEDISGITISDSRFENVERGIYLTGLNPHVGNVLVSRGFNLSNNRLVNTATQATHYYAVEGRELYNLQNLGSVSITGGVSEYAIERAVYVICSEDVQLSGLQVRGSEGVKFSGTQYDGTVTGGPVDRKSKNISISDLQLTAIAGNKHAVILQFVENVSVDGVQADGNGSQAHSAVYVESYAKRLTIRNVRAHDFKRGLAWFRAFKDLPQAGTIPLRPSGSYTREFRDVTIEDCDGELVNTLGQDAAYTPTRVIPFVYMLLEDDLVATLTGSSRIWYDLRILGNRMNPSAAGGGAWRYRSASLTKAFLDINYATRVEVSGNRVQDLGGASLLGVTIGSATSDVILRHELPQITNFDTVPAVISPLYVSAGSEVRIDEAQKFDTGTYATFRYRLVPQVLAGSGGTAQRTQTQDMALAYRLQVEMDASIATGTGVYLGGPAAGANRDFLTGVLNDGTVVGSLDGVARCTNATVVMGSLLFDNGGETRWVLAAPFSANPTQVGPLTMTNLTLATDAIGSAGPTYPTRGITLTNATGATRKVRAVTEFIVERAAVN